MDEVVYIKKIIKAYSSFVGAIINEFFILTGLSIIVYATYRVNTTAALFLLGIVFVLFGLFLAWTRRE